MLTLERIRCTACQLEQRLIEARVAPQRGASHGRQVQALTVFVALTKDIDRATLIFEAVLRQALTLSKSTDWIERELCFEACVAAGLEDRQQALLGLLSQRGELTDERLDDYIERSTRFKL